MTFPTLLLLKVIEAIDRSYIVAPQTEQSLQQISSQFRHALRLDTVEQNCESKVCSYLTSIDWFYLISVVNVWYVGV